jgi:hypothetical protein
MCNSSLNVTVHKDYISEFWMLCSQALLGLLLPYELKNTSTVSEYISSLKRIRILRYVTHLWIQK